MSAGLRSSGLGGRICPLPSLAPSGFPPSLPLGLIIPTPASVVTSPSLTLTLSPLPLIRTLMMPLGRLGHSRPIAHSHRLSFNSICKVPVATSYPVRWLQELGCGHLGGGAGEEGHDCLHLEKSEQKCQCQDGRDATQCQRSLVKQMGTHHFSAHSLPLLLTCSQGENQSPPGGL